MLMQNFKTASDLGLTEPQKEALMKTLVLLETGKLEHSKAFDFSYEEEPTRAFSGKFNMRYWTEAGPQCGTIACIGGTAELISGVKFEYSMVSGLRDLFQPALINMANWADITPAQAATALRSYLTTGDARWDLAVS
jgi:hypothetical protein